MKKLLRWISIQLMCFVAFLPISNNSFAQILWGMTSDGGSKKTGGNIFSINGDGTGFSERYAFFKDVDYLWDQRLLNYGDGYLYGCGENLIYRLLPDGTSYEALYVFDESTGTSPNSKLLKGNDGYLYGTTRSGGSGGVGVIFKVKKNGTGYQVLKNFAGGDGEGPNGLIQFNSGQLYGIAEDGGISGNGLVFTMDPDGSNFHVLHYFDGTDGSGPSGALVPLSIGSVNYLFGVAHEGGTNDKGVIYRIQTDGSNFSRVYNFKESSGAYPQGPLTKVGNVFYGTAGVYGNFYGGVVFKYDPNADSYTKLREFDATGGTTIENAPLAPLVEFGNMLYGTTMYGGSSGMGVIFRMDLNGGSYQVIHEFDNPVGSFGLLSEFNNKLYGLTGGGIISGGLSQGTIYQCNTDGTSFQVIHAFGSPNGYGPSGSLIRGQDGKLYGQTTYGGNSYYGGYGGGEIFSIEPYSNNFTPLRSIAVYVSDGFPRGSLVLANNGNFYGMTYTHGTASPGRIFQFTYNSLYSLILWYDQFGWGPGYAANPVGSLIQASDGYLYGMTSTSGTTGFVTGKGDIFKINTDGTGYTILKEFSGTDGATPEGSLIQAPDGYLYGMTEYGGTSDYGTIFKIKTNGTGFQTIFQFGTYTSAYYGSHPKGSLLLASDGKLYGTASSGGTFGGGTLFSINKDGTGITRLIDFNSVNGYYPIASVIEYTSTGYLFGMTEQGGTSNLGVVFKIKKDGTGYQTLLNFDGTNGKYPRGDLLIVPITAIPNNPPVISSAKKSNSARSETNAELKAVISVFPNPVKQTFTIRFQKQFSGRVNYTISDLSGRELIKRTIDRVAINEIKSLDISSLPTGTYLLELSTPNEKFTQKILKQ